MSYDLLVEEYAKAIECLLNARGIPQHDERGTIPLPERVELALGAASEAERERCVKECDKLAEKWFAEQRHSWGMAAGEVAAKLEESAAIREQEAD